MPERIEILFVHHLPIIGGATQSLFLLLKHAKKENFKFKVLFLQREGDAINYYKSSGFDVITTDKVHVYSHAYGAYRSFISRKPYVPITHLIKAFLSVKAAKEILLELNPQIVYLNTSALFPFAIAAKGLNLKVIWHLREQIHDGNFGIRKALFKYLFRKFSDEIISISNINSTVLKTERVITIYNSVNSELFNSYKDLDKIKESYELKGKRVITFLGGNLKSKGSPVFIKAAEIIIKEFDNIEFIIAGNFNSITYPNLSPTEKKVYKVIKGNPQLKNSVQFVGVLQDVSKLIAVSDIIVWPAIVPHFSRPVMEALYMGIPVVASDFPSTREIVDDGVHGILVDPVPEKIAHGITTLLSNDELFNKLKVEGIIRGRNLFDGNKNNSKILNIIRRNL